MSLYSNYFRDKSVLLKECIFKLDESASNYKTLHENDINRFSEYNSKIKKECDEQLKKIQEPNFFDFFSGAFREKP
jgi:hypothetical protein